MVHAPRRNELSEKSGRTHKRLCGTWYLLSITRAMLSYKNKKAENPLVDTLEWRNSFALVLIQSRADNATILDVDLRGVDVLLEGESVLHPLLIVTLRSYDQYVVQDL